MGHVPRHSTDSLDIEDLTVGCGFACIVGGIAWRYDLPLALIVFGIGLLFIGAVAMWRHA